MRMHVMSPEGTRDPSTFRRSGMQAAAAVWEKRSTIILGNYQVDIAMGYLCRKCPVFGSTNLETG